MPIPNVSRALRGWTKPQSVRIVTKTVVNHIIQQTAEVITLDMMLQPLQPEKLRRKPEEQRSWKWYSILVKASGRELKPDDQIVIDGIAYRIDSRQPWTDAGYRRYEATEDYTGLSPMYALDYSGNGSDGGTAPATIAYQEAAEPTVLANPFTKTGYTFDSWNTAADGSGTEYDPGDTITMGTADVTLYAIWEAIP